jgi:hypothetical protein
MDDKNIPFFTAVSNAVMSKNKNSVNNIFNGKYTAFVTVTAAFAVPLIIASGLDRQWDIIIRSNIMLK